MSNLYDKLSPYLPSDGLLMPNADTLFTSSYSYCGPGNPLDNGKPINGTDDICREHDYAYDKYLNDPNKKDIGIRNADLRMINKLDDHYNNNYNNITWGEVIGNRVARAGIKTKMLLEDYMYGAPSHNDYGTLSHNDNDKVIASLKYGGRINRDGLYYLHKGELVVPANK
jgi:hypothetical protein